MILIPSRKQEFSAIPVWLIAYKAIQIGYITQDVINCVSFGVLGFDTH
jgi:hypothetical protein